MRIFCLLNEVIERAARRGDEGGFEWKSVEMVGGVGEEGIGEFGEEFWREYFECPGPHFGLFVVRKG